MSTVPLTLRQWIVCTIIASFSLPVGWWSRKVGARSVLAQYSTSWFNSTLTILTKAESVFVKIPLVGPLLCGGGGGGGKDEKEEGNNSSHE